jgi:BMFP domain-containing protein YqiC
MQIDNRLLDDMARVASGALGALAGVKDELEVLIRQQFENLFANMELVNREEFEAVKAMAAKARTEQDELRARLQALESRLAAAEGRAAKPSATARPKRAGTGARRGTRKPPSS